jgi:hypothetical protein
MMARASGPLRKVMKPVAASLPAPLFSSTASCRIGEYNSCGTSQREPVSGPVNCDSATKPSSALPVSTNW